MRGGRVQQAIIGPSAKRHLNILNSGLVALGLFSGSGPVFLRNPIFVVIFQGGFGPDTLPPPPPSGSTHGYLANVNPREMYLI